MPVNGGIATYSDYAFYSAVAIYLLAALLYLREFARSRIPGPVAVTASAHAGGSTAARDSAAGAAGAHAAGPPQVRAPREDPDRCGRMAVALSILGALVHISSVVLRGIAVARWPWGNMYEFISAICLMAVLGWLYLLRRAPALRPIGVFVLLPAEVLLFLAGTALYVQPAPVMPALQSYWLSIHVTAVSIASGLFMVSGVISVLYLIRQYADPRGTQDALARLPSSGSLDSAAYRITIFAFVLYTFAIICGAIWAEAAWGRYWGWDPKETVAFVVWVLYACYLHARSTAGWRTGAAAWVNVAGFAAVVFNLFYINLVTAGLHSYAGMG